MYTYVSILPFTSLYLTMLYEEGLGLFSLRILPHLRQGLLQCLPSYHPFMQRGRRLWLCRAWIFRKFSKSRLQRGVLSQRGIHGKWRSESMEYEKKMILKKKEEKIFSLKGQFLKTSKNYGMPCLGSTSRRSFSKCTSIGRLAREWLSTHVYHIKM